MLAEALHAAPSELRLIRADRTDRTQSFVVAAGNSYIPGGPGRVGDIAGSILCRNSGTGHSRLLVVPQLTRLICMNGMAVPLPRRSVLAKRHKGLDDVGLKAALGRVFENLSQQFRDGVAVLIAAEAEPLNDPPGTEVDRILELAALPQRLKPAIMDAFLKEPLPSRFGVSQALTAAAKSLLPEMRIELEEVASRYLQGTLQERDPDESGTPPPVIATSA